MNIPQPFRNTHGGVSGRAFDLKSLCFVACLLAIIANALIYTWLHSNPLLTSDAWYFLDAFVRKVVTGDLSIVDFFVKRGGSDHAQPLNKLVLYLNVVIFGMDSSFEGLAGIFFAVASLCFIFLMVRKEIPEQRTDPRILVCLLAIAGIFLSLSSSSMYTWSLVTMGYSLHLLAFWLVWLGWRSLQTGRWRVLFVSGIFIALCIDDSAFIIFAACVAGMLFIGYRLDRLSRVLRIVATILLALVLVRLVYAGINHSTRLAMDAGPVLSEQLIALRARLPEVGRLLLLPSAGALVQAEQMRTFSPEHWQSWQLALGLLVIIGQLWFWVTIWRARANGLVFMAVCLMLLAYGYLAGVIYVRVPQFGSDYLYQPRYALFYLLVPVALLLLAIERLSAPRVGRPEKTVITIIAAGLIALQLPLSLSTWHKAVYVDNYYQVAAGQMFELARNPNVLPQNCVPELKVCDLPEDKRAELFGILRTYRLNLFSREFDDRHNMHEGRTR